LQERPDRVGRAQEALEARRGGKAWRGGWHDAGYEAVAALLAWEFFEKLESVLGEVDVGLDRLDALFLLADTDPDPDVDTLIREIDEDPVCAFWR
jgi:hypothetical protein